MSKVTIPTRAIKMVENIHPSTWDTTKNKFITIIHDLYPHLTYKECEEKFLLILDRKNNIDSARRFMAEYKQKIKSSYDRWSMYKKFNQQDEIKTCEHFYLNVDKKGYDRYVDTLYSMGVTESYAPSDMNDIPRFLNQEQSESNTETSIIMVVVCTVIVGLILWAFNYGLNN
jgi:hypothetical protein